MSQNGGVLLTTRSGHFNQRMLGGDMMDQEKIVQDASRTQIRSGVIRNPANEFTLIGRPWGNNNLYNPFTGGEQMTSDYERVAMIGKGHMQERIFKKNPLRPATSFVPRSVLLEEQPAVNVAEIGVGQPSLYDPYSPERDTPAPTVANSLTEARDYRQQVMTVNSLLGTRAQQRRMVKRSLDRVDPSRPQIIDINKHREFRSDMMMRKMRRSRGKNAFAEVKGRQQQELVKKLAEMAVGVPWIIR